MVERRRKNLLVSVTLIVLLHSLAEMLFLSIDASDILGEQTPMLTLLLTDYKPIGFI